MSKMFYSTEEKETMRRMYSEGKTPTEIAEVMKDFSVSQIARWCCKNIPEDEKWTYGYVKMRDGTEVRKRIPKYKGVEKRAMAKEREAREARLEEQALRRKEFRYPKKMRKPLNDADKKLLLDMYRRGVSVQVISQAINKSDCAIYRFIRENVPEDQRQKKIWVLEMEGDHGLYRDDMDDYSSGHEYDPYNDDEDDDDDGNLFPTLRTPLAAKKKSSINSSPKPSTSFAGESSKSSSKQSEIAAAAAAAKRKAETKKKVPDKKEENDDTDEASVTSTKHSTKKKAAKEEEDIEELQPRVRRSRAAALAAADSIRETAQAEARPRIRPY